MKTKLKGPRSRAEELFDAAFLTPRSKRSVAYGKGVLNHLKYRLMEIEEFPLPYEPGTAESDAYYSGVDESWKILRRENADLRGDQMRKGGRVA